MLSYLTVLKYKYMPCQDPSPNHLSHYTYFLPQNTYNNSHHLMPIIKVEIGEGMSKEGWGGGHVKMEVMDEQVA